MLKVIMNNKLIIDKAELQKAKHAAFKYQKALSVFSISTKNAAESMMRLVKSMNQIKNK